MLQKLWILHQEVKKKINTEQKENNDKDLDNFTNELVAKITNNLEKFHYNVIVANMYETYNFLVGYLKKIKNLKNLETNYKKMLICFTPVIPHFTNECLKDLNIDQQIVWPEYDKAMLEKDDLSFVIQINGKKRSILKVKKDILERELLEIVKKDKNTEKYLKNMEIKKIIFVKNRLMNILINE